MPLIRTEFGTTIVSLLLVAIAIERQRMLTTWPMSLSTLTQSPRRSVFSSCSEMPAHRLPRIACAEKASAPVSTAEVVTIPARLTPTADNRTSA